MPCMASGGRASPPPRIAPIAPIAPTAPIARLAPTGPHVPFFLLRTRPRQRGVSMPDPLDQQLVEAVLARPTRRKVDLEEARLANIRPSRAKPTDGAALDGDGA